jgi:phosphoglycolate phosphatase
LVLFDIDGTLMKGIGSRHKSAILEGVRRVIGHSATFDGIDTAGRLDCDLIDELLRQCDPEKEWESDVRQAIAEQCQVCFEMTCADDLSSALCRDVVPTLDALTARGTALGLVTGNLSRIGWRKIELAGLQEYFSVGAFAEDGNTRSELAKIAVERSQSKGFHSANACISLIGDHTNDVAAAKANGFLSVAVATGVLDRMTLQRAEPDILIDHLGELDVSRLL